MHWVSPTKALKNRSARRIAWVSFVRYNGRRRTAYLFVDNRAFESEVLAAPDFLGLDAVCRGFGACAAALRRVGASTWALRFCGAPGLSGCIFRLRGGMLSFFRPKTPKSTVRGRWRWDSYARRRSLKLATWGFAGQGRSEGLETVLSAPVTCPVP